MTESAHLTEMQQSFVDNIVTLGCSGAEAARRAGYSENSARFQASNMLNNPKIQEAIRKEQVKLIGGTLASKALRTLEQVMDDPDSPTGARVDAAKTILDRAGLSAVPTSRESITPPTSRKISDLNTDELIALIEDAKALMAEQKTQMIEHVK